MKFKKGDTVYFFEKREDIKDIDHEGIIDSIGWDPNETLYMVKMKGTKNERYKIIPKYENELMTIDELLEKPTENI